ncbi:hypothetical protein G8B22_08485 [Ligilactobacillus agilis]|nr:hypothetical protein [Ligilactobacillus agilis]UNL43166.1 hypothetical protein G8B22_08485 [Ligilactobacillus agilis]
MSMTYDGQQVVKVNGEYAMVVLNHEQVAAIKMIIQAHSSLMNDQKK